MGSGHIIFAGKSLEWLLQSPGEGKAKQKGYQDGPTRGHRKVEGKNSTQLSLSSLQGAHAPIPNTHTNISF